ncbi:MAG: photosystem II protein Psb27 [Cyanobacteriota bacterium]|nr:photosystem II protein Psb27 [Cyanobacteriota bacterium]
MAALLAFFQRRLARAAMAACLCLSLLLGGCGTDSYGLTGDYVSDTVAVADALIATVTISSDDPDRSTAESRARGLINDYMARYRPQRAVNGLGSFTTMQTALNSIAGHYANYPNRPVPDALRDRVSKELKKASSGATRGA